VFLSFAVAALAFRAKGRHGYGPFVLGLCAAIGVLLGKFEWESNPTLYVQSACWRLRRCGISGHVERPNPPAAQKNHLTKGVLEKMATTKKMKSSAQVVQPAKKRLKW
jgi:hypothetical protein